MQPNSIHRLLSQLSSPASAIPLAPSLLLLHLASTPHTVYLAFVRVHLPIHQAIGYVQHSRQSVEEIARGQANGLEYTYVSVWEQ